MPGKYSTAAAAAVAQRQLAVHFLAAVSFSGIRRGLLHHHLRVRFSREFSTAVNLGRCFAAAAPQLAQQIWVNRRSLHATPVLCQTKESGGSGSGGRHAEAVAEALLVHWCGGLRGVLNDSAVRTHRDISATCHHPAAA